MNPDAAVVAAARGQVDVVAGLPFAKIAKAEKAGLQVQSRVSNHPIRMAFNREGLFRAREMRHALAYAIDREKLAQVVYQAGANVADTGFFQAGQFWTTTASLPTYAPDAAQATALLEALGWTRRDGRWLHQDAPVTLRLLARKPFKKLALALADQLEAFGLGVDVRVLGRAEEQNALKKRDFDLALLSTSSQGDPGSFARRVVGPSWKSDRFSEHADMNALMAQQAREMDRNKRRAIFEEVQAIYAAELPAYMLVNKMRSVAHNARIKPVFYEDGIAFGIPVSLHKDMFLR
ncbi:MAG TPA: hypothetical protein DD979_12080 [Gammaproteobacteria bacterium]|nr:hypothetical protein [Gammaproteobacteria bacterium]